MEINSIKKDNMIRMNLLYPIVSIFAFASSLRFLGYKVAFLVALMILAAPFFAKRKFLTLNLFLIGYPFLPDMITLMGAFAILFLYIMDIYVYKREKIVLSTFYVPVALVFVFILINTFTSLDMFGSLRDFSMNVAGIAIFLAIVTSIKTKEDYNKIATSLAIGAAFVCLWGILQFKFFGTVQREWVDADVSSQISARAYSVFMNPNVFAEYIVLLTPIVVSLFWAHKDGFKKFVFLGITGLLLLSLLLTFSRGGIMSVGVSALVFLFFNYRPLIALAIPFALLGMNFLPESIRNRIMSITNVKDSSTSYRFKIWSITKDVVKDHPQVGVGFGHKPFKETFETYIRSMPIFHAHNTYLQVMAEGGYTGFITFLVVVVVSIVQTIRVIYNTKNTIVKTFACGVLASIAGILVHGMFEDIIYINRIIMMIWIVLALSTSLTTISKQEN